jgi:hypothetical protein
MRSNTRALFRFAELRGGGPSEVPPLPVSSYRECIPSSGGQHFRDLRDWTRRMVRGRKAECPWGVMLYCRESVARAYNTKMRGITHKVAGTTVKVTVECCGSITYDKLGT